MAAEAQSFLATLARAGKSHKEIKPLMGAADGDKTLSISQINWIIKALKEGNRPLICATPIRRRQDGPTTSWHLTPLPLKKTSR